MARRCSICAHERRGDIDALLLEGAPFRHIASRFGVSTGALQRHKAEHLPAELLKSREAEELASADNLLAQLRDLQQRTLRILEAAEGSKEDHLVALRAVGEARRNLELLARLTELLGPDTQVNLNVTIDARVQQVILDALAPYPEARLAVADALGEIEGG